MHARFPFAPLTKYPHLAKNEVVIWDKFLKQNPDWAERVDYDVTCGEHDILPPGTPEHTKEDWDYLRSWKIDVVAFKNNIPFIIEVRPRAGLGAIGEVLSKAIMFLEEHSDLPQAQPVIITDAERPNVRQLCAQHDIAYIII